MDVYRGRWHGRRRYFGLHYDLHASERDTDLGLNATPDQLVPMLKLMGCQFVQTDCKGHRGYTSWPSRTPGASVSPGVKRDALQGWREATRELGLPLHCHYSGVIDHAAAAKHPGWAALGPDGRPYPDDRFGGRLCPRGPYADKLLIPHMLELIDNWRVDGFWVDGEIWGVVPCYCKRCRKAFAEETGITEPPTETEDPDWLPWINFTRRSFYEYVTRYCDAVHAHKPGVLVCSNWLQTFKDPGPPAVPTDWISGDNVWVFGLDGCRCESRFISTRGKHWDIMIWAFYKSGDMSDRRVPWTPKPVQMIQQEAAVIQALGGAVQVYETAHGLRDGRLVPWRMKRLRDVGRFVKARRTLCQDSETVPQVAVLHSESHIRSQPVRNLHWEIDARPVQGATWAFLENHYGVDIMDEWALMPRIADFPVVVAPEQDRMSHDMVAALKDYVRGGGRLLVSGAAASERFGPAFLGATKGRVVEDMSLHVSAADGACPVHSTRWRLLKAKDGEAFGTLGKTSLLDDRLLPNPAAVINRVGKGRVAYLPFDAFRFFADRRYPLLRRFIAEVARKIGGRMAISADAPTCVDVVLRRKGSKTIVHLINRSSGIPNCPGDGTVDEVPAVGPVTVRVSVDSEPDSVRLAFEDGPFAWSYRRGGRTGRVVATLDRVRIHAAIVLE
jgi:hypothetical protein